MIPIAKPLLGDEEKQAVLDVLDSGMLAQGRRVATFEEAFAKMAGVKYAIATSSGTTALHTALLAKGIGPGDEVITSPFSFIASANTILYTGAKPVFADINPQTFNIDPNLVEAAITPQTKAIMPVHLFGLAADMASLLEIARNHNLVIVEDACQSHGAEYHGQSVGSFGTGCFSLYPTKNITSGEGGMITTDEAGVAQKCRIIRQHGMARQYYHDALGFNFRMTDVHAAIGLAQLDKLSRFNQTRIDNATLFNSRLKYVTTPQTPAGYRHVFNQYTIRVPKDRRDVLRDHLQHNGVTTGIYYPIPVHQQPLYTTTLGYTVHLPHSEKASQEVLSLPVHPALSPKDLLFIINAVNDFFRQANHL